MNKISVFVVVVICLSDISNLENKDNSFVISIFYLHTGVLNRVMR